MTAFARHRWFVAAAGITLAFASVSLFAQKGPALTAFADITALALMLAAGTVTLTNAWTRPGQQRSFWAMATLGFALWTTNQVAWTVREVVLHLQVPDPYFFDIILFFHAVPLIAAIAWRPDQRKKEGRIFLSLLSFLMLLGWWIFLYAFIVFPHQYVVLNVNRYNDYYDQLFGLENILLLAVLGLATWTSSGGWRRLYAHFTGASLLYAVNSQLLDRAAANNTYYSGSLYDVPLMATIAWMAAAAMSSREWELKTVDFNLNRRLKKVVPQLAMLAILSLPMLGVWTVLIDQSPGQSRVFRVYAVLAAMLILGAFVFLRQYLQDQTLMALLQESRRAYESQKQLQSQLVQKEKLASLGNLIAGAACEIEYPLNAIMGYSEQLWSKGSSPKNRMHGAQDREPGPADTRSGVKPVELCATGAGEKILVDLSVLLSAPRRCSRCAASKQHQGQISSWTRIFPTCMAMPTSSFRRFVEIIENAMDALEEVGGGSLEITRAPSKARDRVAVLR